MVHLPDVDRAKLIIPYICGTLFLADREDRRIPSGAMTAGHRREYTERQGHYMIELPEVYVLAEQINRTIVGKTVKTVIANAVPHGFAQFSGDPSRYPEMLEGKKILGASPDTGTMDIWDCNVEVICGDILLSLSTPMKYLEPEEKLPKSHQLLLEFEDGFRMCCTVQMWGAMLCVPCSDNLPRRQQGPNPLTDGFDETYFDKLWNREKPTLSIKGLLATQKRIPGLGNGVLQDILFQAGIHPKRKLQSIGEEEKARLFQSIKATLKEMRDCGGRDTEKDLFNRPGGYRTILSAKTIKHPCTRCGGTLVRESYLGGNIYYCPVCQRERENRG